MQKRNLFALTIASLTLLSAQAHAALPTEATAAFTSLKSDATDTLAQIWPIAVVVVGGFALLKLFKKGASKAV